MREADGFVELLFVMLVVEAQLLLRQDGSVEPSTHTIEAFKYASIIRNQLGWSVSCAGKAGGIKVGNP